MVTFNNILNLMGNSITKTGGGSLLVNNSLNTGGGSIVNSQGIIGGGGTIGADVNNDGGTISPGNAGLLAQSQVPEPAALVLLVIGAFALCVHRGGRRLSRL